MTIPTAASRDSALAAEEYKDLRVELLAAQHTRILALGFTFTALGVLAGVALAEGNRDDQALVSGVLGLGGLLICAALHLTTALTQRIDRLADYIKDELEQELHFGWETKWRDYRKRVGSAQWRPLKRLRPTLPLGTSKPLAVYYLVFLVGDLAVYIAAAHEPTTWGIGAVLVPNLLATYLALNLYFRFPWHLGWTALGDMKPRRRWRAAPRAEKHTRIDGESTQPDEASGGQ